MAGYTKILLSGDAAELSTNNPASVGTAVDPGSGAAASKDDHVHDLGADCIDSGDLIADDVVDSEHIAADAIGAEHIDGSDTGIAVAQLIFTPASSGTGTTEGTTYYDTEDKHLYVYVGA